MHKLKIVAFLILLINLYGCSKSVVYEEESESDLNTTRIIKIDIVRKTCNTLTLNVTYFNDGNLPGYLRLSPNAGIPKQTWPFSPKMKAGTHTMEIQNSIQNTEDVVYSQEVSVAIEHIIDNTWSGYIDRKTFSYEEEWSNNCLK